MSKDNVTTSFYSWDVLDDKVAIKHCDKSFFEHHGMGIPKELVKYWKVDDVYKIKKKNIEIIYKNKRYKAHFIIDGLERIRMFWNSELQNELKQFYKGRTYPLARYEKIDESVFKLEIVQINKFIDLETQNAVIINENKIIEEEKKAKSMDENTLYQVAKSREKKKAKVVKNTSIVKIRDPYISEYAKRKANGVCQLCKKPAPFNKIDGEPYLESHHIIWLSKGGEDTIENTVALCPNCHRKMHILNKNEDVIKLKNKDERL